MDEASLAKAAGITIFVIGLGRAEDLDDTELREVASLPEYYFRTSDATALTVIYVPRGRFAPTDGLHHVLTAGPVR
jgi:hypothetical protein